MAKQGLKTYDLSVVCTLMSGMSQSVSLCVCLPLDSRGTGGGRGRMVERKTRKP